MEFQPHDVNLSTRLVMTLAVHNKAGDDDGILFLSHRVLTILDLFWEKF